MSRDMSFLHLAAAAALALVPACATDEASLSEVVENATVNTFVFRDITADTTWTNNRTFVLLKDIFVRNATLTIQPGTIIKGRSGTSLVVTTSGRLVAAGTADAPVVFTADGTAPAPGAWGGVILLGNAPINVAGGTAEIEGFPSGTSGVTYGGNDPAHDCGSLTYVRIEYAGFELSLDNELNGLTVGGCGSGTVLDYIQVHKGADDGIEFFGGTVNLKHAVISQPDDDGLDWDFGWSGKAQFVIVQQNAAVGNNGIEADNNNANNNALPRSNPTLWNVSLIGSNQAPGTAGKTQLGALLRRGTAGLINNAIVAYFTDSNVDVNGTVSEGLATSGELAIASSIFYAPSNPNPWTAFEQGIFVAGTPSNRDGVDPGLVDPLDLITPVFAPASGSPALTGGGTPPSDGFFDSAATFVGAVGESDWTAGWTAYPL